MTVQVPNLFRRQFAQGLLEKALFQQSRAIRVERDPTVTEGVWSYRRGVTFSKGGGGNRVPLSGWLILSYGERKGAVCLVGRHLNRDEGWTEANRQDRCDNALRKRENWQFVRRYTFTEVSERPLQIAQELAALLGA